MMTYVDIYEQNFLDKFGKCKSNVESIILNNQEIDVLAIANACEIPIEYYSKEFLLKSKLNQENKNRKIIISKFEHDEYKQRVFIARQIGSIILNLNNKPITQQKYAKILARINDVEMDNFAYELLMPSKLVKQVIQNVIKDLDFMINENFGNIDIQRIIEKSSLYLNVSKSMLSSRIDEMKLFIDSNNKK